MSESIDVWAALEDLLGRKLLLSLSGISKSELRRYKAEPKSIPLGVFSRIDFLMELTDILRGGYNKKGVREWFGRARRQLDGFSPSEIIFGKWRPDDPGPRRVLEIAKEMNV